MAQNKEEVRARWERSLKLFLQALAVVGPRAFQLGKKLAAAREAMRDDKRLLEGCSGAIDEKLKEEYNRNASPENEPKPPAFKL